MQHALPELLLGRSRIEGVLQFSLEGLELLAQVPLEFLSLVPGQLLRLEVLLQLRQLGLQLSNLLQSIVLMAHLFLTPEIKTVKTLWL